MTQPETQQSQPRRHVVGFILGSIIVGVIGLVTAIVLTVSGTLNTFREVSTSYDDVFDTGTEVGPIATQVELDDAHYALLTFATTPHQPTLEEQAEACSVMDEHGEPVPLESSSQPITDTEVDTSDYNLTDVHHVIYLNFEVTEGVYGVSCEQFGMLSTGESYSMGGTAIGGMLIGIISVVVAAILFVIGLVNHRRNRSGQRHNPRRFIDYRLENF